MAAKSISASIAEFLQVGICLIATLVLELIYCIVGRPRKSIKDKVILITGAAQGIGRLAAGEIARLGAKCVLVDVNQVMNDEAAKELRDQGLQAWSYACDISSEKQIADMHQWILREVGPVDVLMNNAAIVNCQAFEDLTLSQIRRNFEVNTFSHFMMIKEFLPSMKSRGQGHIVATCSVAGILGTANLTDYCASKFAVRGLMMALRDELRREGFGDKIAITNVCPVAIHTTMFRSLHSRFSSILPILKAETAAQGLVDAMLTEQPEVIIPKHMGIMNNIFGLLPLKAVHRLHEFTDYSVGSHTPKTD